MNRELADLLRGLRWREWMCGIEAVRLAGATPVSREDLARVVGQGVVDLLIEDLVAELLGRRSEIVRVTDPGCSGSGRPMLSRFGLRGMSGAGCRPVRV